MVVENYEIWFFAISKISGREFENSFPGSSLSILILPTTKARQFYLINDNLSAVVTSAVVESDFVYECKSCFHLERSKTWEFFKVFWRRQEKMDSSAVFRKVQRLGGGKWNVNTETLTGPVKDHCENVRKVLRTLVKQEKALTTEKCHFLNWRIERGRRIFSQNRKLVRLMWKSTTDRKNWTAGHQQQKSKLS